MLQLLRSWLGRNLAALGVVSDGQHLVFFLSGLGLLLHPALLRFLDIRGRNLTMQIPDFVARRSSQLWRRWLTIRP